MSVTIPRRYALSSIYGSLLLTVNDNAYKCTNTVYSFLENVVIPRLLWKKEIVEWIYQTMNRIVFE